MRKYNDDIRQMQNKKMRVLLTNAWDGISVTIDSN